MLLNLALFQAVWFAAVIGASFDIAWAGLAALSVFLLAHYVVANNPLRDFRLVATAVIIGLVVESAFVQTGLLVYAAHDPWEIIAPLWILVLWASFTLTMNGCIAWLQPKLGLASVLGALGGPLSYFGGIRLGAANAGEPLIVVLSVVAVIYALATPLLLKLASLGGTVKS